MASTDKPVGEPEAHKKDYVELIEPEMKLDKKFLEGAGEPVKIIYYCPDCEKVVTPKRVRNKFQFSCEECKGKVAFGTEEAIANYYHIPQGPKKVKKTKV